MAAGIDVKHDVIKSVGDAPHPVPIQVIKLFPGGSAKVVILENFPESQGEYFHPQARCPLTGRQVKDGGPGGIAGVGID